MALSTVSSDTCLYKKCLSWEWLKIERNIRRFGITPIVSNHNFKFTKKKSSLKFSLIPETVRDRAKWMKIWEHTKNLKNLPKKVKFQKISLNLGNDKNYSIKDENLGSHVFSMIQ